MTYSGSKAVIVGQWHPSGSWSLESSQVLIDWYQIAFSATGAQNFTLGAEALNWTVAAGAVASGIPAWNVIPSVERFDGSFGFVAFSANFNGTYAAGGMWFGNPTVIAVDVKPDTTYRYVYDRANGKLKAMKRSDGFEPSGALNVSIEGIMTVEGK